MSRDDAPPAFRRAVLLAPLAAPLALLLGSAARAALNPRVTPDGINPVVGVLFLAALLTVYGAPLAYGATLVILWPAAALLRDSGAFRWWSVTLVAALSGAALFPAYLRLIDPRGTWDFFPGAGFAAGAATGWVFWFIAMRPGNSSLDNREK